MALHILFSFIKKLTTYNFNFFQFPGKKTNIFLTKTGIFVPFWSRQSRITNLAGWRDSNQNWIPRDWSTVTCKHNYLFKVLLFWISKKKAGAEGFTKRFQIQQQHINTSSTTNVHCTNPLHYLFTYFTYKWCLRKLL